MSAFSEIRDKDYSTVTDLEKCMLEVWEQQGLEYLAENGAAELATLRDQLTQAQAERDALKEALKPFAKEGIGIYAALPDNMRMYLDNYDPTEDGNYGKTDLTIGDFRKAAALVGDA